MKRHRKVNFITDPLTVYDTETWNPILEDEYNPLELGSLDVDEVYSLGKSTIDVVNYYGIADFLPNDSRVEGEEVGDDRVDFSLNPLKLATCLVAQERVCRMATSLEDTNLSAHIWNFCEISSVVPLHPDQSFDKCRKTGEFKDLGFIDVPPLRILLDVMKGDRSHSSTSVGKASMLGARMKTPRSEFLPDFFLASYLQDGYLNTCRSTDPKYLPQIMGGSGVRALFSNPLNLHLYVHAYRGGRCQRIYGSATRELRQSLDSLEKGDRVIMPILNRKLRDRQEYLHGTYDAKIFIPSNDLKDSFKENAPPPLIKASGGANLFSNFENRLQRTKHVVTRTDAEREWENTIRIRERLLSRYTPTTTVLDREKCDKQIARRQFGNALTANTAFANLLARKGSLQDVIQLTQDNFLVVNCGATHFSKWDAEWLFFGGKSDNFSIEDLTSSEDLFLRSEVSEDETMRVGSIPLRPIYGKSKMVLTTTTVGLYQIGSGMYEWASDLTARLIKKRQSLNRPLDASDALEEYEISPEWVNDDSLIISRCLRDCTGRAYRSTGVILVSADRRLGNQLANTCNVHVYRVNPVSYIMLALYLHKPPLEEMDCVIAQAFMDLKEGQVPVHYIYVDTGSVNAALSRVAEADDQSLKIKVTGDCHILPRGRRQYSYELINTDVRSKLVYMTHVPVLKPKRFRGTGTDQALSMQRRKSYASSKSATSNNWRSGI